MSLSGNDVFLQRQLGHASLSTTQIYVKSLQQRGLQFMDSFEDEVFGQGSPKKAQENISKFAQAEQVP